jgi:hypothetical protein
MPTQTGWTCPHNIDALTGGTGGDATPHHTPDVPLRRNAQQLAGGVAEDRGPLGVAQARRAENVLDGRTRPRIGIIGPHHDLTGAAFRHQMPQRLRGEDDRVEVEIPQILAGPFLQRHPTAAVAKG